MHGPISILALTSTILVACATQPGGGRDSGARIAPAEAEIARLPITYAWAVDRKDIDLLMTVFSRDVEYDLSAYGFSSAIGWEAVRETFLTGILPYVECSFISISNIRIEVDGDTARGADYFVHAGYNPSTRPPNTRSHTEGQHFYEFVKEEGGWKISYMKGSPFYERWEPFDPDSLRDCRHVSTR